LDNKVLFTTGAWCKHKNEKEEYISDPHCYVICCFCLQWK